MAYKERKFTCEICGKEFLSRQKSPRSCSKSCKMKLMGKQLKEEKIKNGICEWCNKEFEYFLTKRRPVRRFCTNECSQKHRIAKIKENGLSEETKKKISNKLKGKTLRERGFSEESINNSITALKEAGKKWNKFTKGKTYEEIHGEEKAKKLRKEYSRNRRGEKNSFFGKHHSIETKDKIVKNREGKFYTFASGTFNNIMWQGSYELKFLEYCYLNNIPIKRYDLNPIEYNYKGIHHYYPDFIICDVVIECKGYSNEQNLKKIEAGYNEYGDNFKVYKKADYPLSEVPDKNINSWYRTMQEKYKDILIIKYNPHERDDNEG